MVRFGRAAAHACDARQKINADLRAVLAQPDVVQKFAELSTATRDYTPEQVADFIRAERRRWTPVVQRLKLNEDH